MAWVSELLTFLKWCSAFVGEACLCLEGLASLEVEATLDLADWVTRRGPPKLDFADVKINNRYVFRIKYES